MEKISIKGLTLFFDPKEQETAEYLRQACERTVPLINESWGLDTPKDCRVYVMTSWLHFLFHTAPWYMRILLAGTIPLWFSRKKKQWAIAAGWTMRYKKRPTVGVKPPRLYQPLAIKTGASIMIKEDDIGRKIQNIACHELTHAFSAHLKLPMWLNEGLAMVTMDKYAGKPMVRSETIKALQNRSRKTNPGRYRKLNPRDIDAVIYHFVRGYWITRYIEENRPGLLKGLLKQRYKKRTLESKVAEAFGMNSKDFWHQIDGMVCSYFLP